MVHLPLHSCFQHCNPSDEATHQTCAEHVSFSSCQSSSWLPTTWDELQQSDFTRHIILFRKFGLQAISFRVWEAWRPSPPTLLFYL